VAIFEKLWSWQFWRMVWRLIPRRLKPAVLRFGLWHLEVAADIWRQIFTLSQVSRADYHREIDRLSLFALRWSISLEQLRRVTPHARIAALLEQAAHEMAMIDDKDQAVAVAQLVERYRPFGKP